LQPERQSEIEAGTDVDLLKDRVHLELTYYSKRNTNALYNVPLGSSIGGGSLEENVGTIWNWGYEALISSALVTTSQFAWDVSLNGSVNHNQILKLGPHFQSVYGLYGIPSIVAGYPIYSQFALPYTYADESHNGIIDANDISYGSTPRYYGQSIPPIQATAATHVSILNGHVRIGALLDYRGGFVLSNQYLGAQCFFGDAHATVVRGASLRDQAACVAYANNSTSDRGLISNGSFVSFRELSVTFTAPNWLGQRGVARSLSFTVEARNLALWTHFSGGDPEAAPSTIGAPSSGGVYSNGGGLPPAQYWLTRVNFSF
jgi:hypothetical protein